MGESADIAKKFTCPALRKAIDDREVSRVMSRELMATLRNNASIPDAERFPIVRELINIEAKDNNIRRDLIQIEQQVGCIVPEEKICGQSKETFVDMSKNVYKATYNKEASDEFIQISIDSAKYMCIVDKNTDDPRVKGNR